MESPYSMSEISKELIDRNESVFEELIKKLRTISEPELYYQELSDMLFFINDLSRNIDEVFKKPLTKEFN